MACSKVALLVIGSQILTGRIADTNTQYAAKRIHELGASLDTVVMVPDNLETVAAAVKKLASEYDFVLTSGGLGPTVDDITVEAVAKAFDQGVSRHTYLATLVCRRFEGADLTASQLRLANVPEKAELIVEGPDDFPQVFINNVYLLPGRPAAFRRHFENVAKGFAKQELFEREIPVKGMETKLASVLVRVAKLHPNVSISCQILQEDDKDPVSTINVILGASNNQDLVAAQEFFNSALPHDITLVKQ